MKINRKIKIFVDAHSFDKEHQGIRSYIKRLYIALSLRSDQFEFYFGACDPLLLATELKEIQNAHFLKYRFSSTFLRLTFEVPRLVRKYKFDYAHFQYIAPLFISCSTIVTTHDVLFLDFKSYFPTLYRLLRQFLFSLSIRKADIKTTVSEYSRGRIAFHFNINSEKILITSNGIGSDYFKQYDVRLSQEYVLSAFGVKKYILYVSRFEPRKNHIQLLNAYLSLRLFENNYSLVMVGHRSLPTPHFDSVLKQVEGNARNHIFIIDSATEEELYHLYRGAKVFVYPSFGEGFGLPPIEAAALKVPVICSNATAMADFDFFGVNHVSPLDNDLLRDRLAAMISGQEPNEKQLDEISKEIARRYSFTTSAALLEEAILKLERS